MFNRTAIRFTMSPWEFTDQAAGVRRKKLEVYYAWIRNALPPKLSLNWDLVNLVSGAAQALAGCSGTGQLLPNSHFRARTFNRRHHIASARFFPDRFDFSPFSSRVFWTTISSTKPARPLNDAQFGGSLVSGGGERRRKVIFPFLTVDGVSRILSLTKPARPLYDAQIGGLLFWEGRT